MFEESSTLQRLGLAALGGSIGAVGGLYIIFGEVNFILFLFALP